MIPAAGATASPQRLQTRWLPPPAPRVLIEYAIPFPGDIAPASSALLRGRCFGVGTGLIYLVFHRIHQASISILTSLETMFVIPAVATPSACSIISPWNALGSSAQPSFQHPADRGGQRQQLPAVSYGQAGSPTRSGSSSPSKAVAQPPKPKPQARDLPRQVTMLVALAFAALVLVVGQARQFKELMGSGNPTRWKRWSLTGFRPG